MNEQWVMAHRLHYILGGSRLYGTDTPESDCDFRGVCEQPVETLLGLARFDQYRDHKYNNDIEIYGLNKFLALALDANPNILDILFAPPETWLVKTWQWQRIYDNRHAFLSQKVRKTFSGYALGQMKSMAKHREWLLRPPSQPKPEDYNCRVDTAADGGQKLFFYYKSNEQAYQAAKLDYDNYRAWVSERNPKRLATEMRVGYDTKNAAHLMRLLYKATDILRDSDYNPQLGGQRLADIKCILNGWWDYNKLMLYAKMWDDAIGLRETALPAQPNRKLVEELAMEINYSTIEIARIAGEIFK
jgi:uncharacterized protein